MRILVLSQSRSRSNWAVAQLDYYYRPEIQHLNEPYKYLRESSRISHITRELSSYDHCIVKLEIGDCEGYNSTLFDPQLFDLLSYDCIYTLRRDDILSATASILVAEHFSQWAVEKSKPLVIEPHSLEFGRDIQRNAALRVMIQHRNLKAYQRWLDLAGQPYYSYDYSNIDHLCRNWDPNPNATIALEYDYPLLWKDWKSLIADVEWEQSCSSNLITWG